VERHFKLFSLQLLLIAGKRSGMLWTMCPTASRDPAGLQALRTLLLSSMPQLSECTAIIPSSNLFSENLKGLSNKIDFKNVDEN
jgi:hypothetical protein